MRRRVRKEAIGMALFPFLAVLICTMGALVVLLVLLVQQAKVEAETLAADQTARQELTEAQRREQQLQYEDAMWRHEVLKTQRQEKQQELADKRLELSHIEDHIRRLEDTLRSAAAQIKELQSGKPTESNAGLLARRLAELERTLAKKRRELDAKRQSLAHEERSYTLVPYQGRSGTRRVPMYVECVAEGIIVQPEGILLTAADMDGPLGPGNPLDAALRAKREYLAQVTEGKGTEPYPLLVVRPDGVMSYSGALAAMKNWEDEFGYELVAEDLNLDFGERDPKASQRLDQAVRDARRRQAVLVASMPRRYHDEASPPVRGGADSPSGSVQRLTAQEPAKGTRGLGSSPSGGTSGTSDSVVGSVPDQSQGSAAKAGHATEAASGQPVPPSSAGPSGVAGHNSLRHGRRSAPSEGSSPIGSGFPQPGAAPGMRGQNWGLPAAAGRTFGVTRPIRVICLADRLVVLSDRRDSARPAEIQLSAEITPQQINEFVTALHRQMESWGLAAENGYWKPQLQVEVARDAESRFAQLQDALQGSGIDVHRKVR